MLSCRPFLSPPCTPKWSRGITWNPHKASCRDWFSSKAASQSRGPGDAGFCWFLFCFFSRWEGGILGRGPCATAARWLAALIFRIWATHRPLWFSLWGTECHLSYSQLGIQAALVRKKMTVEHSLFAQIKQLVLDGESEKHAGLLCIWAELSPALSSVSDDILW